MGLVSGLDLGGEEPIPGLQLIVGRESPRRW